MARLERNSQMFYRPQTCCLGVRKEFSFLDKALHCWQQCSMGGFLLHVSHHTWSIARTKMSNY